jgi:hypothetical protein
MKIVAIPKQATDLLGQLDADSCLAATADAHKDDDHGVSAYEKDNCHPSYGSGDDSWLVDDIAQPEFFNLLACMIKEMENERNEYSRYGTVAMSALWSCSGFMDTFIKWRES